jgi:hypothetical protein
MTRLMIVPFCAFTFSVAAQPRPEPAVSDQMARDLCHCVQSTDQKNIIHQLDSCYHQVLRVHYSAIQLLGLDSAEFDKRMQVDTTVGNDFKIECPLIYKKYSKANAAELNNTAQIFTGEFVSQDPVVGKKYYLLTLRSADGQLEEFHSDLVIKIPPPHHLVTVKYKVEVDPHTKKETWIALSIYID